MPAPKIAIIGAGPAGLTLARILQKNGIPSTVYEAEASRAARNQGGSLDLHPNGGQQALQQAGLFSEFQRLSRPEAELMKLVKADGTVVLDENQHGNNRGKEYANRPEIDRVVLRDMLLDSVADGTIRWGKKLQSVAESAHDNSKHDLHFTDGTVAEHLDLVVGADGAWSKVRPLLTSARPFYAGVSIVELWALDVERKNPWLAQYVGGGSCFMFDEARALMCQVQGNGSIRAYAAVRQPQGWIDSCGIDWSQPEQARELLIERYFADCSEDLKRVIRACNDELVPRPLYMLSVGIHWESKPGVTMLGDAAHLMTPFAGVGVNIAMTDALDLANMLTACKNGDNYDIARVIKEYESSMFVRAEHFARKTMRGLENHFSANGVEEFARASRG